ncbi:unnamed protein product, partial [Staurois parvus]
MQPNLLHCHIQRFYLVYALRDGQQFLMHEGPDSAPLKNDISTLWDNIAYNSMKEVLTWVPLCTVKAKVHLCWMTDDKQKCVNIPDSSSDAHNQVSYTRVDTHPRLCMKFATETGSWVKCPFPSGPFSAWDMKTYVMAKSMEIRLTSPTKAKFSVFICNRT